jgi:hypothetical protein
MLRGMCRQGANLGDPHIFVGGSILIASMKTEEDGVIRSFL